MKYYTMYLLRAVRLYHRGKKEKMALPMIFALDILNDVKYNFIYYDCNKDKFLNIYIKLRNKIENSLEVK